MEGYVVSFDTDGGEVIESQKLRHGSFVEDPGTPVKVTVRFDLAGGTVVRTSQRIQKVTVNGEHVLTAQWK